MTNVIENIHDIQAFFFDKNTKPKPNCQRIEKLDLINYKKIFFNYYLLIIKAFNINLLRLYGYNDS